MYSLELSSIAKMAVAMLSEHHSKALQELFSLKLKALGITEMKDLAFLLGSE